VAIGERGLREIRKELYTEKERGGRGERKSFYLE